jgi:hypothetical protein
VLLQAEHAVDASWVLMHNQTMLLRFELGLNQDFDQQPAPFLEKAVLHFQRPRELLQAEYAVDASLVVMRNQMMM